MVKRTTTLVLLLLVFVLYLCEAGGRPFRFTSEIATRATQSLEEEEDLEVVQEFETHVQGEEIVLSKPNNSAANAEKAALVGGNIYQNKECYTKCSWYGDAQQHLYCWDCEKPFVAYTPSAQSLAGPSPCYDFPSDFNSGKLSVASVNEVKKACQTVGKCKCKQELIKTMKSVVLLRDMVANRIKDLVRQLKATIQNELVSKVCRTISNFSYYSC